MKIETDSGPVNINVARYDWAFDEVAGNRVQRFSRALPPEVWIVGWKRGVSHERRDALVVMTFELPASGCSELLDEIAAHFPASPPADLLEKLRALAPKKAAA